MKRKNVIIGIIITILIIVIGVVLALLLIKNKGESGDKKDVKTYEMYVKINPLVKLVFNTSYENCVDDNGEESLCGGGIDEVVDYEFVNNDAKEIYNDLNFYGMTVYDVLVQLCDTARDNKIGFEKLEITSDYENINQSEISSYLKDHSKYDTQISVLVDFKEYIKKDDLLSDEEKNEPKEYSVIFNSDGGSKVKSQLLKEGEKVKKPENPTKQGYDFVEWVLDNKTYDFDKVVTQDLKLKAKWKRNQEETTTSTKKTTSTTTTSTTKKGSSTTKKTTTTTADKYTSTFNKINLNENFLVRETYYGTACSSLIFATNYNTVFQDMLSNEEYKYADYLWENVLGKEEYARRMNSLVYDSAKEANAKAVLEQLKNSITGGIINYSYGIKGHEFTYRFDILELDGDYGRFGKEYDAPHVAFYNKVKKAFTGAIVHMGGCGSGPDDATLLTEELCKKYNLTCSRW